MQSPRRDTSGGVALGEGGLRRHEGARGGGSGEFLATCGGVNGPETRADQGVCVATRGSRYANSTRPKRATHDGRERGLRQVGIDLLRRTVLTLPTAKMVGCVLLPPRAVVLLLVVPRLIPLEGNQRGIETPQQFSTKSR